MEAKLTCERQLETLGNAGVWERWELAGPFPALSMQK